MWVLDASAILALLQREPGSERVAEVIADAVVGAVSYSEVLAKLADKGVDADDRRTIADALQCEILDFDVWQAEAAAALRPASKSAGLSFADRACLALAQSRGATAVTADRAWATVRLGISVEVIR